MNSLSKYILEKLHLNKNIDKQIISLEDKLTEILEQGLKDEDYEWYKLKKLTNEIRIYFPNNVRVYFKQIIDIINTNLEGKYDSIIKKVDWNLLHSYISYHL